MIPRRTATEIAAMRRAGRVVHEMHEVLRTLVRPGVSTAALDAAARDILRRRGARSNFLGYHGFPAVICTSVNDVVLHGIPDETLLAEGDIISIDCGAIVDGWHGDGAITVGVESIGAAAQALIDGAEAALAAGIGAMRDRIRLGSVGGAIDDAAAALGLLIIDGYGGHGIGRAMHEPPDVPNWGDPGRGPRLRVGNTLCLEPMVSATCSNTVVLADGWSVRTVDGSWAAHAEHTVLVGDHGPECLTG